MKKQNKFRLKNKQYRNAHRKKNYHQTKPAKQRAKKWTKADTNWIMKSRWNDRLYAFVLKRSVQAIQQRRYMVKKGKKNVVR